MCGKPFTAEHCLSCPHGGYPIHRHNDLRDYTASLFSKVCSDVSVEPPLQPLSGEQLTLRSANREEGVRLDIAATNFWSKNGQRAFFDIRVFNPLSPSNHTLSINSCYQKHEQEKRRGYDQRVREVEHGCFAPLVFNTLGGMGPTARVVYMRLASLIATKTEQPYSAVIRLIRCQLNFSLLRSTIDTLTRKGIRNFNYLQCIMYM